MYDITCLYRATSIGDAVAYLAQHSDATVISGGTDVLIKLRAGSDAPCRLVSIHRLPALSGITLTADGSICIKPATCFAQIAIDPIILRHIPILASACDQVGSPQIRETGTIGGNICNGAVSADSAPALLALEAVVTLESVSGTREVKLREFYTGPGKTVRRREELLTNITIKRENYEGFGGAYTKFGQRKALEIATIGCAVSVKLSADKSTIEAYRIAFGVAAPTPVRCPQTERAVIGAAADEHTLALIAQSVLSEVNPRDSWRASKVFRTQLIKELSKRVSAEAIRNAGGNVCSTSSTSL